MIKRNIDAGRLKFTVDIETSVSHGNLQFIAVGTPPDEDGSADLRYVVTAAKNIGRYVKNDIVITFINSCKVIITIIKTYQTEKKN